MPRITKTDPDQLYWSEQGRVGCGERGHTPYPGTDTWIWEHWSKVTYAIATAWLAESGKPMVCENCGKGFRMRPLDIGVPYFRTILKDERPRPRGTDGVPYAVCPVCGAETINWDGYGAGRHWSENHEFAAAIRIRPEARETLDPNWSK